MGISLNPATLLSGQGLDVTSVVSQIIASEAGPLTVWSQQQTTLASENGALDGINNAPTRCRKKEPAQKDQGSALFKRWPTTREANLG